MANELNVLVTGAAGFIGSNFVKSCIGSNVKVVSCVDKISYAANLENIKYVQKLKIPFQFVDINNYSAMAQIVIDNRIDAIINFAAETHVDNSIRDVIPFMESNIMGVQSLLEVCKKTNTKLIHISTDEVYGPAGDYSFKESDSLNPKNPYSATKASAENLIQAYVNTFGIKAVILRPTNNFGPGQNKEKFIPKYLDCLDKGKKFPLYGDGKQVREWLYVKDCADIIKNVIQVSMEKDIPPVINIGCHNSSMTNLEVCERIFKLKTGSSDYLSSISFVEDRLGHDRKYSIDLTLLNILGIAKESKIWLVPFFIYLFIHIIHISLLVYYELLVPSKYII